MQASPTEDAGQEGGVAAFAVKHSQATSRGSPMYMSTNVSQSEKTGDTVVAAAPWENLMPSMSSLKDGLAGSEAIPCTPASSPAAPCQHTITAHATLPRHPGCHQDGGLAVRVQCGRQGLEKYGCQGA